MAVSMLMSVLLVRLVNVEAGVSFDVVDASMSEYAKNLRPVQQPAAGFPACDPFMTEDHPCPPLKP
jgi:hypothetical protein